MRALLWLLLGASAVQVVLAAHFQRAMLLDLSRCASARLVIMVGAARARHQRRPFLLPLTFQGAQR
jgi:hypothetical protein